MAGNSRKQREEREVRTRLRRYEANRAVHEHQNRRRRRDNLLAVLGVVVVAALATVTQVVYFTTGPGAPEPSSSASASPEAAQAPASDLAEGRTWTGEMVINGVALGLELDGAAAPQGVSSFIHLAQESFYEGLTCHRLTTNEGFRVLQCGDPNGDGTGGPGYSYGPIENAPADDVYPEGTLAMARQGNDGESMGSQFFLVYGDTTIPSDAAGGYTVLGTVTRGLDELRSAVTDAGTADADGDGAPAVPTTIESVTVQ